MNLDILLKLPQRIVDKIHLNVVTECWEWTGSRNYKGYGHCHFEGHLLGAHRVVWTLLCGDIADGLVLDHLCRVRHCVNPAHMEPVTVRVNTLRGNGPHRPAASSPASARRAARMSRWTEIE